MSLFVEDFMEGIMGNAELFCHHKQFQDPEQMEILKEKLCSYFKYKLDGSRFYIGKSMSDVHRELGITNEVFDNACQIFLTSLKKFKPKAKVLQTFVKRIGAIRNEICFPPVKKLDQDDIGQRNSSESLINDLGQETGLRNIVDSMLEQARFNNFDLFNKQGEVDDQQLVIKYSMFLQSLMDPRYEWFHKDLIQSNQLEAMLINEDDLETMISYFRTACVKNNLNKATIVSLLEFLTAHKDVLCFNLMIKKGVK